MITIKKTSSQGISLPQFGIGFDHSSRQNNHIFISHAHADHMPRNRSASVYCTCNTYKLMQQRGYKGKAIILEFEQPIELDKARVTLYPAGHILGSAMVFVETDKGSVLYTGDYRTPPSPATEGFKCPHKVDHFITEATFSLPVYRWKSYDELGRQVRQFALQTLQNDYTPVFMAYNLGKAQEIMHLLAPTGLPVQIHEDGYKMCSVYEEAGIELGNYAPFDPKSSKGTVLIGPSSALNKGWADEVPKKRLAYCSGWAVRESSRTQFTADTLIPLSDHLDFFELINLCKKLNPRKVHITHTPNADVVQHYLNKLGIESMPLDLETEDDD